MPKLQKRTPLSDSGLSANITTLEDGLRYESLPHDTEQPLTAKHDQVASSGALNSSSYSPQATARVYSDPFSSAARQAMEPNAAGRASPPTSQSQPPQSQRRSVDLRRLNGTPYEQAKKYTVARDMHAGELPPAYRRQASDPLNPAAVAQASGKPSRPPSSGHDCGRCGRQQRTSTDAQLAHHDCNKCGKKKSMSTAGSTSPAEPRGVSMQSLTALPPVPPTAGAPARNATATSPTVAGPSTATATHKKECHKCGRPKRPMTMPLPQAPMNSHQPPAPDSASLPNQRPSRVSRAGLSITPTQSMPPSSYPKIDIVPPSASTYRPRDSGFSVHSNTPLVAQANKKEHGHFRNNSIIRSLSRRLSSRGSKSKQASNENPLPSQRASQAEGADMNAGRLINMISNAIKDSGEKNKPDYQRLSVAERDASPSSRFSFEEAPSPFSFQEAPNEDQAFEMMPLADKKEAGIASRMPPTAMGWKSTSAVPSAVATQEKLDVVGDKRSKSMRQQHDKQNSLSVPQNPNRPPITRFKSLREGVNRAASVSRQTSLRRFESLKRVGSYWERNDMAIEGHTWEGHDGQDIPVY